MILELFIIILSKCRQYSPEPRFQTKIQKLEKRAISFTLKRPNGSPCPVLKPLLNFTILKEPITEIVDLD